jgi:hypothetical protein
MTETNGEMRSAAIASRDEHGRFLTGNSGGGRLRGSRNKLTDQFLAAIADDFAEHGAGAIAKVRMNDPATYLKLIGSLVPRGLIVKREESPHFDYAGWTEQEVLELIELRRKQKYVETMIKIYERE